jgi:diguanylate cyclase (GGDEF)-like protein/PAS domain S-box-containing protein
MVVKRMISLANLLKLSRHKSVEDTVLDELFSLERSTLITTMLLETILLYILTPLIGNIIIAWYGIIMALSLWRFYNAYDYYKHPERNPQRIWHEKFVVQVWLTALLFSGLALYAVPRLDAYYQLFTFMVLIGISSGAIKALSSDHRTAIGYLLIILVPLMLEMVLLMRQDTLILAFLVALYLFVQVSILLHAYELSTVARAAREEMEKTRKALQEKQKIIHHFFEQTDEALFLYDRNEQLIDCNRAFELMFDIPKETITSYTLETFPDVQWVDMINQARHNGGKYVDGYQTRDGRQLWLETKCLMMEDSEGDTLGGIGLIKDKTAEHVSQQELAHMALHDPMTGLSNRRGFQQYMDDLFADEKHRTHFSLFFYIDVNKFKQINDRYGHETGDAIIVAVTQRLKETAPPEANVTRLGGDEFCIVLPHVGQDKITLQHRMEACMQAIRDCFSTPFVIGDRTFDLRCSTGVVAIEPGETDIDKVVAQADISMLQAKRSDSSGMVLYSSDLEQGECEAYEVHHTLGDAIQKEQLELFYQPVVRSRNGNIVAAEALVRWRHPKKGLLPPKDFLPIAVRSGQVTQVDTWVLEAVLKQIAEWKKSDAFDLNYVSINVDVQSLMEPDFVRALFETMDRYGISGKQMRLELSEFSLVGNMEETKKIIEALTRRELVCIVDDFGSGCLSLFHLKHLPLSAIKTDRMFIQDLTGRIENVFLLQTVVELAQKFRYDIVVKGVESQPQREVISRLNPDACFQGALSAEPLPADAFARRFLLASDTTNDAASKGL